jgi:hypothetical protein
MMETFLYIFPIANRWASIIAEKQYNKGLFGGHK